MARKFLVVFVAIALGLTGFGLAGCSNRPAPDASTGGVRSPLPVPIERVSEISPPAAIQALRQQIDQYRPQVRILSPRPDAVLDDDQVTVQLQVQDYPTFKDETLDMGPHLHFILDNQPYQAIYNPDEPIVLTDLEPGTHTIRAFASRPWHESFKTDGAYAQTTFHVFTKTPLNQPSPDLPLLTYSRPKGSYGAEPILLDFYLANTPLHMVAQADPEDEIADWQIRCTVNGQSFTFASWEPVYLNGFVPGKNWIQLELLDENGDPIPNAFNNTARLITYNPGGQDTLSRLVRGELSAKDAGYIVDPNYSPPPEVPVVEEPPVEEPLEEPLEEVTPTEVPEPKSDQEVAPGVETVPDLQAPPELAPEASLEAPPAELEPAPDLEPAPEIETVTDAEDLDAEITDQIDQIDQPEGAKDLPAPDLTPPDLQEPVEVAPTELDTAPITPQTPAPPADAASPPTPASKTSVNRGIGPSSAPTRQPDVGEAIAPTPTEVSPVGDRPAPEAGSKADPKAGLMPDAPADPGSLPEIVPDELLETAPPSSGTGTAKTEMGDG